jgi:hypothetical protein
MNLPKADVVDIAREKLTEYLLSTTHREGRHKAAFFLAHGFAVEAWELLAAALPQHAAAHPLAKVEASRFGNRYIVEGIMETPDGRTPKLRSVWFIDHGVDTPRFVTAYPLEREVP